MAMQLTRNLRDGELKLIDGNGQSLVVVLDDGDLSWTETANTIEVKDRGSIAAGHTRPGDDESVELAFTAKWTSLIGVASDPLGLYEFLTIAEAAGLQSTSASGEQKTLTIEFSVNDPGGDGAEKVTFEKVYRESLTMSEGDDANRIAFAGRAFVPQPSVVRVD